MKYCQHCGNELLDTAVICPKCGSPVSGNPNFVASQNQYSIQNSGNNVSEKNWVATFLLCFLFGGIGIHRFYVGRIGSAIAMILTLGGLGFWWLVDLIVILFGNFKDSEGKKIKM